MTFSDIHVGHNDLGQHRGIEERTILPKEFDYLLVEVLYHSSSLPNTDNRMVTVTLKMGSRSKCSYGTKALVRTIR